jgi:protein SCO1/2
MIAALRRWFAAFLFVAAALGGGQAPAGDVADPRSDASAALSYSQAAIGRSLGDYAFTNDLNRKVDLAVFRGKPLVISLVYTSCADVCPTVSESLADAVDAASELVGSDTFNVITVGFDARHDTPQQMRAFARSRGLERPNWQFLSADGNTIDRLAAELGFLFYASPRGFDHLSQTTVVDSEGRVYRHVYGAELIPPQLVEPLKELVFGGDRASGGWAGLVGQVRLFCTFYDPASGRYRFDYSVLLTAVLGGLSLAGVAIVLVRSMLQRRRFAKENPSPIPPLAYRRRP